MSSFKRATKRTVLKVLKEFTNRIELDKNEEYIVDAVNNMLDELRSDDFFGTEGQCDPRGDPRD